MQIKEGDEHKVAFKMCYGLFKPTVMFFGLTNSPATFQAMMDALYADTILYHEARGTTIHIYMDNIGIATKHGASHSDHIAAVRDVFRIAHAHDLFFKLKKSVFHSSQMEYLGVVLKKGVTMMDPIKVDGLHDWPTPKNVHGVRSLLGFSNFYRPFIKQFTHLTLPLTHLTKKDAIWQWRLEVEDAAFRALIHAFTHAPVLVHPVLTNQFTLEVDASSYAIGAVLLQRKEDGKPHNG